MGGIATNEIMAIGSGSAEAEAVEAALKPTASKTLLATPPAPIYLLLSLLSFLPLHAPCRSAVRTSYHFCRLTPLTASSLHTFLLWNFMLSFFNTRLSVSSSTETRFTSAFNWHVQFNEQGRIHGTRCVFFTFENNWGRTNGRTDGRTDTPSYRDTRRI